MDQRIIMQCGLILIMIGVVILVLPIYAPEWPLFVILGGICWGFAFFILSKAGSELIHEYMIKKYPTSKD